MNDSDPDPVLEELLRQVGELGLGLDLGRRNTPGQLSFAVPVRGLDSWRATLRREGKRVAYGDGVTEVAAIRDALRMLERTSQG
jgi:hypothetical protein